MKNINKIGMMIVASGMLAATSCSDFSDYNDAPYLGANGGDKTLWENISSNPRLSDFAAVLQRVGYDTKLNASRTYTVWAPVNGSFNVDSLANVPLAKVEKEFVKCHISDYAHLETDQGDTVVYMLNKKLIKFSNKNTAKVEFDGVALEQNGAYYNLPCSNGVLYTMPNRSNFRPNGYEIVSELDGVADKFKAYVEKYEHEYLDLDKSVKGEIIDGVQHYDDSVVVVSNDFIEDLNYTQNRTGEIFLNAEDSIATLLVLSDAAWEKTYNKIKSYYNYIPTISYQNLGSNDVGTAKGGTCPTSATGRASIMAPTAGKTDVVLPTPPSDAEISVTEDYWKDSLVVRTMLKNIIFSHGYKRNAKFASGEAFVETDTILSTQYTHGRGGRSSIIPDPRRLDEVTENVMSLSNGNIRILNDFPFEPSKSYAPVIRTRSVDRKVPADLEIGTFGYNTPNPDYKLDADDPSRDYGLLYVKTNLAKNADGAIIATTAPELDFYLDNVLSTKYDVYLVVVPAFYDNPDAAHLPYSLRVDINYTDETNTQIAARFDGDGIKKHNEIVDLTKVAAFVAGAEKVDTVKLGRIEFPICYANTDAKPNIKVMHTVSTFSSANKKKYTQELRVANIILRPVEEANTDDENEEAAEQ